MSMTEIIAELQKHLDNTPDYLGCGPRARFYRTKRRQLTRVIADLTLYLDRTYMQGPFTYLGDDR